MQNYKKITEQQNAQHKKCIWHAFCHQICMKKCMLFLVLFCCTMMSGQVTMQQGIRSIRHKIKDFRDSTHVEIRQYKDSVREVRRHAYDSIPHEIRIGWGDQSFETIAWRDMGHPTVMPPTYQNTYNEHFRYTQHLFAEYIYNATYRYSFGALIDYSGVLWDQVLRDGTGVELQRKQNRSFHNIVIMPEVRFSYLHKEYVSCYSALGVGLNINTGTEVDYRGRRTAIAPAVNISLFGLRVGQGRWYGAIEIGGMISLTNTNEVYMLGSRIFTASVGARL